MSIFYYGFVNSLNSVPTKIEVGSRAIVVSMDRAMKKVRMDKERKNVTTLCNA